MFPFCTHESFLFLTRRAAGVPGYQYKVDLSKEFHMKQIFSKEELAKLKTFFQNVEKYEYRQNIVFDEKIHLINVNKTGNLQVESSSHEKYPHLFKILELKHPSELEVVEVDDKNLVNYLNDDKFQLLSEKDQKIVKAVVCFDNIEFFNIILNFLIPILVWIFK
jgi:hypothetical protein